jgi:hypothetical protein
MTSTEAQAIAAKPKKRLYGLVAFLCLGYYLPIFLVWSGVIPFAYRYHVLIGMTLIMVVYAIIRRRSWRALGFRRDTLPVSLAWNIGLSLVFGGALLALYFAGLIRQPTIPSWNLFFVFYIFISSPAQEFLFRSMVFAEMAAAGLTSGLVQVLLSAVTFCSLHIIYRDPLTLGVTLFMGLVWGFIYFRAPNFYGVTLSHAVLGAISIAVGLV